MISPHKEFNFKLEQENQVIYKDEKISNSNTCFEIENEEITNESKQLQNELTKAELTVDQLEKMIKTTAKQVNQLEIEFQESEKDYALKVEEKRCQNEYESKEINALETELEHLQKILDIRNEELEKAQNTNVALKNEIIANRYKIFHMHFNELNQQSSDQTESSVSSPETTSDDTDISVKSSTVKLSELSDET